MKEKTQTKKKRSCKRALGSQRWEEAWVWMSRKVGGPVTIPAEGAKKTFGM